LAWVTTALRGNAAISGVLVVMNAVGGQIINRLPFVFRLINRDHRQRRIRRDARLDIVAAVAVKFSSAKC
jgi:hypothetical protein